MGTGLLAFSTIKMKQVLSEPEDGHEKEGIRDRIWKLGYIFSGSIVVAC